MEEIKKVLLLVLGCAVQVGLGYGGESPVLRAFVWNCAAKWHP